MKSEKLIKTLTAELKPVSVKSRRLLFAVFALIFVGTAAALSLVIGIKQNLSAESALVPFLLLQAQVLALALVCAVLSARLSQPGRRPSRVAYSFPIGLIAVTLLDLLALRAMRVNEPNWGPALLGGQECLIFTSGVGALMAIAALAVARTQATTQRTALGAVIGAGALSAGALVVNFACANANPAHVCLWHLAAPLVLLTTLAAFISNKLLRW